VSVLFHERLEAECKLNYDL